MNSDPFYRQLVKVMQESNRESTLSKSKFKAFSVANTRQSSRYKDDLQAARIVASNSVRQKPKRKYKTEMPLNYSEAKIGAIFGVVQAWTEGRSLIRESAKRQRAEYLQQRIETLRGQVG